jgi:plastocyanin
MGSTKTWLHLFSAWVLLVAACGDDSGAAGTQNLGGSSNGGGGASTSGTGGEGGTADICALPLGATINGCAADGSDALDATGQGTQTILFGGATPGFNYDPQCLLVDQGQDVIFDGDFSAHPLRSGEVREGAACPQSGPLDFSGTGPETFTLTPGIYPYYCQVHGDNSDMAGLLIVR